MGYSHIENKDEEVGIIATRIKQLREKSNETQKELAEAIFCTKATIANIEQGKSAPSLENAKKIAQHYQTTTDFICGLSDDITILSKILDTLCHCISLEINRMNFSESYSHEIPTISIKKYLFDYLNVLAQAKRLKEKDVPDEVIDAWCEKKAEETMNLLQAEENDDDSDKATNNMVKYALLSSRKISSDEVLKLLEKTFIESLGDDRSL